MCIRKSHCTLLGVTIPDVARKREEWTGHLSGYDKNKLVFLDESGVDTNLTRIYRRAAGERRCIGKKQLNTPKNTTILSSIRLNGETMYIGYQGGTTKNKFIGYLKNVLVPILIKDDIIIMDNMRTYHSKEVKKVIKDLKINVLCLPLYSPDLNPIEKM
jgi:hypothetical protein